MRFFLGMIVGVVVAKPILNVTGEYMTVPVRRYIASTIVGLADRLNEYVDKLAEEDSSK